jgi:hypothetical protein
MVLKSALFICFLLSTATISWASPDEQENEDGSGAVPDLPEDFFDDEDLSQTGGVEPNDEESVVDNMFDSATTDDEEMTDESGSGEEPASVPNIKDNMTKTTNLDEVDENETNSEEDTEPPQPTNDVETEEHEDETPVKEKPVVTEETTSTNISTSHFLAALIVGGCVGLLFAICVIMLLAYRIRKKDEGSYALDEQKKPASPTAYQYTQGQEYYA